MPPLKGPDVKQRTRTLLEQPLAMIFGWKALGEPLREPPRFPTVQMKDGPLADVVADAMPVERGLAADMQSFEAPLQQDKARVQGGRIVRPAIDPACQPLQPAGTDIVDGKVGRYPQGGEVIGGQRRPRRQARIEPV